MKKQLIAVLDEEDIPIADCVQEFLKYHAELDWVGSQSGTESEIQEHGITSPPEQLWYAAAIYTELQNWANINPQYPIAGFRADFMIDPIGSFVNNDPFNLFTMPLLESLSATMTKFVVEIDGFEWHDKTPEQAEQDKRRERIIQQHGYRLFRYAAREVLRDPLKCVREMRVLIHAETKKACASLTIHQTVRTKKYEEVFEGVE